MKLVHSRIERQIDFDENFCYELIIENQMEFFNLTNEIIKQADGQEGDFVLSEGKLLDFAKNCLVIYDYYNLGMQSKRVQNLINSNVVEVLKDGDFVEKFANINQTLAEIGERVKEELDFNVETEAEFDFESYAKFSNFKLVTADNLKEDLCDFVSVMQKLTNFNVVILINAYCVLGEADLKDIIKQLHYDQLNVLFVDSSQRNAFEDMETIIIDNDLCEI